VEDTQLLFPIEELADNQKLQKFAFESVRETVYERLASLLAGAQDEDALKADQEFTNLSGAMMKAICHLNKQKMKVSSDQAS
jgi:hypothetical protein